MLHYNYRDESVMLLNNMYKSIVASVICVLVGILSPAYALDANSNAKDVADKLNELYSHTQPCANDEPAYYCSGIIIHGQVVPVKDENENLLPSWYLPAYRNVGSFSYLRADITPHTGEPIWVNTGYILTPLDDVGSTKEFNYKVDCAYPGDGGSFGDAEESCHFSVEELPGVTVESTDIKTVDDYISKFFSNAGAGAWSFSLLGFQADKDGFDLAMQLHKYVYKDHFNNASKAVCHNNRCRDHNELIISSWDKNKISAEQVPLIAFFAIINDNQNPFFEGTGRTSTSNEEMEQLFKDADDYSKAAHFARSIPVVTIDMAKLRNGEPDVFAPAVRPQ
jgi:hypothetical protein